MLDLIPIKITFIDNNNNTKAFATIVKDNDDVFKTLGDDDDALHVHDRSCV